MNNYVILDWAGNHKFPSKSFKTFEDGWDFLLSKFENDEDLEEFQVVETPQHIKDLERLINMTDFMDFKSAWN